MKSEEDIKCDVTEIPDRLWESLMHVIEREIIGLEDQINSSVAVHHGAIAHVAGGIHYIRILHTLLESYRDKKE